MFCLNIKHSSIIANFHNFFPWFRFTNNFSSNQIGLFLILLIYSLAAFSICFLQMNIVRLTHFFKLTVLNSFCAHILHSTKIQPWGKCKLSSRVKNHTWKFNIWRSPVANILRWIFSIQSARELTLWFSRITYQMLVHSWYLFF